MKQTTQTFAHVRRHCLSNKCSSPSANKPHIASTFGETSSTMKWLYVFALYIALAAASETPDGNYISLITC